MSGSTCRSCVCGHSPYRSTQRPLRARRSVRVHAEESSQTQNKSAYKPDSQGGDPPGPTQPDKPKEAKPSGRLSFSPNTRSVSNPASTTQMHGQPHCAAFCAVHSLPATTAFGLSLQGIGYTDDDTAGQTNIFAVEVSSRHSFLQSSCHVPADN